MCVWDWLVIFNKPWQINSITSWEIIENKARKFLRSSAYILGTMAYAKLNLLDSRHGRSRASGRHIGPPWE